MIVFKINSHVTRNQGSALMRFFGREVVTYMPTLVKKRFDQAALIQKRSEQQMQVAKKLGRRSVDMFKAGDMVVAQNARTGKWTIRGRVTKGRTAEDGTSRSFCSHELLLGCGINAAETWTENWKFGFDWYELISVRLETWSRDR